MTRRYINLFLVLLMLGAQLAIAQHATIHFTSHGHISGQHDHNSDDGVPKVGEICQICILSKSFAQALTPDDVTVSTLLTESSFSSPWAQNHITRQVSHGFLARGPPSFLI